MAMLELRYIRGLYENYLRYNYTYASYRRNVDTLEDFFGFFPEKTSPLSFLPGDIITYLKAREGKKNLRNHLRLISRFFRWMIDHEYTTFDPVPAALRHPRAHTLVGPESPDTRKSRLGRAARERELLRERLQLLDNPLPVGAGNCRTEPRFPHNPPPPSGHPLELKSPARIVYIRWGRPPAEVFPSLQELLVQASDTTQQVLVRLPYEVPLRATQLLDLTRASFSSGSLIVPPKNDLPSGTFTVSGEILKLISTLPDGPLFPGFYGDKLSSRFRRIAYRAGYDLTLTEWILHCIRLRQEDKWLPPAPAGGKRAQKALATALESLQHPSSEATPTPQCTTEPQPAD